MKTFHTHAELRKFLQKERCHGAKIGLIPTMGALHEGHLSLVRQSKSNSDLAVVSIFVNPTQFNNPKDMEKYPRHPEKDLEILASAGCDAVFMPSVKEMYPKQVSVNISPGSLETGLEGRFRPGHFAGVSLVICKLFNLIQPDHTYFGQKDLQQFFVIKTLVEQLLFPTQLHLLPIVREAHGLAMSSRNERLSPADRAHAGLIYKALTEARTTLLESGDIQAAKAKVLERFKASDRLRLEYFEVISTHDFSPLEIITEEATTALCLAAKIGRVRLIDNLFLIS